jgi:beta-mannosidase
MQQLSLPQHWQFKQHDPAQPTHAEFASEQGWLAATVPGTVHQDLLANGRIPDPFLGLNENSVQWVGESDWLYRCTFDASPELLANPQIELCFEGLDTYATVWLNGERISETDNMFVPLRLNVKKLLQPQNNQLHILFESAMRHGKELEAQYGQRNSWNGDKSRVYVRKAQYHYGWDWGPTLMTAGVWRKAYLQGYQARIKELVCPAKVADDLSRASVPVHIETDAPANSSLTLSLFNPDGALLAQTEVTVNGTHVDYTFEVDAPQLWYPNGYGKQPLYRLKAALKQGSTTLDETEQRIGLRKLRLVQEPIEGEQGASFYFEVNNVPIFSGGANWIPADLLIPRISAEKYRQWLQYTVDAHMVMLRVWGGGIYEEDIFYDLCDEMGILVWQDFMFACGMYPAHPEFLQSVRAEAEAAVRRLRHHVSIALWCGNNEDYQIAQSLSAYQRDFNGDFVNSSFPAREIYERLLPEVCTQLDPTREYWRGSPYGGADVFDHSVGDRHTWDVWHGKAAPYQDYLKYEGRFVSEFGMQAYPAPQTLADYQHNGKMNKSMIEHHNKADGGEDRLKKYTRANMPKTHTLDAYAFATQLMQAEALSYAYRLFRQRWQSNGRRAVGGALVWQLNDCWQVTSWALVDSLMHPKPAYFTVKRAIAPVAVEALKTKKGVDMWAASSLAMPVSALAQMSLWSLDGEQLQSTSQPVTILPNQTTPIPTTLKLKKNQVISVRLVVDGKVIARTALWNEPLKSNKFADPEIRVSTLGGEKVEVSVSKPAKGVWLTADAPVTWSDNALDVFPDDPQTVDAQGLGSAQVSSKSIYSLL